MRLIERKRMTAEDDVVCTKLARLGTTIAQQSTENWAA